MQAESTTVPSSRSASTAVALAAGLAAGLTVGLASSPAAAAEVALLEIDGPIAERRAAAGLFPTEEPQTLGDYVRVLDRVAGREDLAGVVIRLKDAPLALTQAEELSAAVAGVRESGKRVWLFAETFGPTELVLGAATDSAVLQRGGFVSLPGLFVEEMYLAETFEMVGLNAQLVQVGDYKGANEALTRGSPSPAWDENIDGLLDGLYAGLRGHLMSGRELSDEELDRAMEQAWLAPGSVAIEAGLIDAEVDLDRIRAFMAGELGERVSWSEPLWRDPEDQLRSLSANPFAMVRVLLDPPADTTDGPAIAVLHIEGAIADGDSADGLFGSSTGSRTIRNAMNDIARDDNIEGVVVRIDSPGGSVSASEMIWYGLDKLSGIKPVWVSVGSMAASGGYYSAVGGDKIYVNPSSVVGSIGVVGGKITMGELYERGRVNIVERARGPRAAMFSSASAWTEPERDFVRGRMADIYDQFAERVREGRPGIDMDRVGEGRLFVGAEAVRNGMADEIGGLDTAVRDLAGELGLEEYEVRSFPRPLTFAEALEEAAEMLGVRSGGVRGGAAELGAEALSGAVEAAARELLGRDAYADYEAQLAAFGQLRASPVLLTLPRAIRVR